MKIRKLRRFFMLVMVLCIVVCTTPLSVEAKQSTQDKLNAAQKDVDKAKQEVDDAQKEVDNLTDRKNSLKRELNGLNSELEDIIDKLNELEDKIILKESEIEITESALEEAKGVETHQYESMKKHVQFLYEDSQSLYLEIMFRAKSFANFITLSDYVDRIASYEKNLLANYKQTRHEIEELESKLIKEKEELDELKLEAEEEKAEIIVVIESTQGKVKQYSGLLDDAEKELLEYEQALKEKQQTAEALKKQLEEEQRLSRLAAASAWRDISQVSFDSGDRLLLAVLIYCEAGGEPYEGKVAVGSVVINRVLSSVYPSTVSGVVYQPYQFSPVSSGRLAYYLSTGKASDDCFKAADAAMSGVTNVGSALHFRTPIPGLSGIQIGHHIFY